LFLFGFVSSVTRRVLAAILTSNYSIPPFGQWGGCFVSEAVG
jgi:hypothetical protein